MKVLFQSRKTLFSSPGGDTVQILKTKEYLEKLGVRVDLSLELTPSLKGYDIVHLFNLLRPQETYIQAKNAIQYRKKVILSTIYCDFSEYEMKAREGIPGFIARTMGPKATESLKVLARALKGGELHKGSLTVLLKGFYRCAGDLLCMSDLLLPNSESEMRRIEKDFSVSGIPYTVVPNGIDPDKFDYDSVKISPEMEKYRDCVLCVARIEGRKAQLNLVRAFRNLPYRLVLVGKPAPHHKNYYESVIKESPPNVETLGYIDIEKLLQLYKLARVHVLPSWMETTGLSSLEAGVMKCNIVVTRKGDTEEYFGDLAFYCEPDDVRSIERAVKEAYRTPFKKELREKILKNYTWNRAAELTLKAYESII